MQIAKVESLRPCERSRWWWHTECILSRGEDMTFVYNPSFLPVIFLVSSCFYKHTFWCISPCILVLTSIDPKNNKLSEPAECSFYLKKQELTFSHQKGGRSRGIHEQQGTGWWTGQNECQSSTEWEKREGHLDRCMKKVSCIRYNTVQSWLQIDTLKCFSP
jgi:hypothetical protein